MQAAAGTAVTRGWSAEVFVKPWNACVFGWTYYFEGCTIVGVFVFWLVFKGVHQAALFFVVSRVWLCWDFEGSGIVFLFCRPHRPFGELEAFQNIVIDCRVASRWRLQLRLQSSELPKTLHSLTKSVRYYFGGFIIVLRCFVFQRVHQEALLEAEGCRGEVC